MTYIPPFSSSFLGLVLTLILKKLSLNGRGG